MKKMKWLVPLLVLVLVTTSCSISLPFMNAGKSEPAPIVTPALKEQVQPTVQPQVQAPSAAPSASTEGVAALQGILESIYTRVNPSVVNLHVVSKPSTPDIQIPNIPGFNFNTPNTPEAQPQAALGSGFIWDTEGHIVTNNHVVDGAEKVTVTFSDGLVREATVVGADPDSDLAVVKLTSIPDKLSPVTIADSTQVRVGQLAIAIGNPFGLEGTMTVGIISALGRSLPVDNGSTTGGTYTIPDIIQTDAPINPGNSGGVLVNDQGEVVGVTAAIESTGGSNAGIGFVIPSAIVKNVVPALIKDGKFVHPWLGVSGRSLTPDLAKAMDLNQDQRGALIVSVIADSPADKAGLQASEKEIEIDGQKVNVGGDVVIAVDSQPVNGFDDLAAYVGSRAAIGQTITLTVLRNGAQKTIDVTLAGRPQNTTARNQENPEQTQPASAWLGIVGHDMTSTIADKMQLPSDQSGVLVEDVSKNSPADQAGLRGGNETITLNGEEVVIGGDVILRIDRTRVDTLSELQKALRSYKPGDEVSLNILRDGNQETLDVKLGARPNS